MFSDLPINFDAGLIASLPLVVVGGVLSAFNPCCIPMLPSIAVLMNRHESKSSWKGFFLAVLFVLGFATSTAIMGAITTSFGVVFGFFGRYFDYVISLILIFLGLNLLGFFRIKIPSLSTSKVMKAHGGAFITGLLFAFVVVPCSTPVLASVLTYAASTQSIATGAFLLFIYGISVGVPLIITGTFIGWLGIFNYFDRHRKIINNITGTVLIAMGLFFGGRA